MSMDGVFSPDDRHWISPQIHLGTRLKTVNQVNDAFLGPVEQLWVRIQLTGGNIQPPEQPMSEDAKMEKALQRERVFGKPKKERKRGKKSKKGQLKDEEEEEEEEYDFNNFLHDIGAAADDDAQSFSSDPGDYIHLQNSSDEDEDNDMMSDSDKDTSSEDEEDSQEQKSQDSEDSQEQKPQDSEDSQKQKAHESEDSDKDKDEEYKKAQEEVQRNKEALAKEYDNTFATFYRYALDRAKTLDKRARDKEMNNLMLYFGYSEEKYLLVQKMTSPDLCTVKGEVIVDDPVFKKTEMPLLAGAIPQEAAKQLSCLALYTSLSDEPGNFQWRMVNVVDQLTNDLKFSKQDLRARQLGKLGPRDLLSNDPNDCVITVTMYQPCEVPEGDYFYDLKTSQEPKPGMVIEMLTSQTLEDLTKYLLCQSDFICTKDFPCTFPTVGSKELLEKLKDNISGNQYTSKAVYVGQTIYTDGGSESLKYFQNMNKWVDQPPKKEIKRFKAGLLKTTKIKDLHLRFGFPYVYIHQGNCEHILVFNSARAALRVEHREFPRHEKIMKYPTKYCRVDNEHLARWAVVGCDRVPEDPMLLCTDCVNKFCYYGQKKVGEFKLFPFLQFLHFA